MRFLTNELLGILHVAVDKLEMEPDMVMHAFMDAGARFVADQMAHTIGPGEAVVLTVRRDAEEEVPNGTIH
jgi:hypothetical protein